MPDSLSGGNQQKVVVAKWLATLPGVLLLDEPTKGVDVGAKFEIHEMIRRQAEAGLAVLVASSDLPEVLALADRVVVMREGRVQGELSGDEATEESVMRMATSEMAHA
jgi:ABC-type sugar transport system ATPase subunit